MLLAPVEEALAEYERLQKTVLDAQTPSGDEVLRLFNSAGNVASALTSARWEPTAEEIARINERVPGVDYSRTEAEHVYLDIPYFRKLAEEKKQKESAEFFALLDQTYPGLRLFCDEWVSDYGPCTRFGDGKFVQMYGLWLQYQPPTAAFRELAQKEKDTIIEAMQNGCVCAENAEPVIREYESFLQSYPNDQSAATLKKRLSELKQGSAVIRFKCYPG